MNKNLAIRTAVAAVAIPIILWICYQGGIWLWGMVTLFAVVAAAEFLLAEGYSPSHAALWLVLSAIVLNMFGHGYPFFAEEMPGGFIIHTAFLVMTPLFTIMLLITSMVFAVGRQSASEQFISLTRLVWGIAYLFLLYPYVSFVGRNSGDWLLFLFGLLWLGDTAAMFVGKAFGKHKLAPTVSPNKTVEGFVGGIVGAVVVAIILGFWRLEMIPIWQLVVIAILCSIFGQLGDLVESMWKRSLGIKDSSAIIPGHGGVLDRFDSLLFAAPVMYYAMLLIGK